MERPISLLRNARLTRLFAAVLVSSSGDPLSLTVSLVLVYTATRSSAALAGIYAAQMLGVFLVGSTLAATTDRLNRRRLIVRLELVRFLLVASLPFVSAVSVFWLYPAVCVLGGIEALVQPARQAGLTELVEPDQIGPAVSFMQVGVSLGQAIGFATAGFALAHLGNGRPLYLADAVTFLAAAGIVATLGDLGGGVRIVKLSGGVRRVWAIPAARPLLAVAGVTVFFNGMLNPSLLPLAYAFSRAGPTAYGVLQVALIVGLLVGSLVAARVPAPLRLTALAGALWLFGSSLLTINQVPALVPLLLPIALSGAASAVYAATNSAALLQVGGPLTRGTVMAVRFTIIQVTLAAGLGAGAVATSLLGARHTFAAAGVGVLVEAVVFTTYLLLAGRRAQLSQAGSGTTGD
jgi:predicted MFS family arabinose efflux permease